MKEQYREYGSILPCGGRGVRLAELTENKPLFKVGGKELIRYSIDILKPEIVKRLVLAVDYKADEIRQWAALSQLPYILHFSEQTEPGVLAAIVAGINYISEDSVVICNADEIRFGFNLADVIRFHENQGTLATMVTTYTDRLYRHRVIEIRERDNIVLKTRLKPEEHRGDPEKIGLINTGFLILEQRAFDHFDSDHNRDWGGIINPLCAKGQLSAYVNKKIVYFNVGTPKEYLEAEEYLKQNS